MTTLTVGTSGTYSTIAAAVAATHDGDTVLVQAGTYTNDFFIISHKITLQSVGGMVYDIANGASPPNGKAIATVDTDATINGFGFSGATVSDNNGAGIRYEGGNLVVNNCVFWNNQDGILANANPNGTVLVENSEFSGNGAGDGYSHNIYIGAVASFTLLNSYMHDANVGHEVKSRAYSNTIEGNRIFDNAGDGSYSIDLPNGGTDVVANNVIEKGANAPNYTTIHFSGEGTPYAGSSLQVTGNTVVNDNAHGVLLTNQSGLSTVTVTGNQLFGFTAPNNGAVTMTGNTVLAARPTLDTSTLAPAVTPATSVALQPTAAVPDGTHLVDPGPGGAVAASGRVLLVGAGQQFTSLGAALAASRDGDTIDVAAGSYVNDFGTVDHKVIIQGVGGIAHFSETPGLLDPIGFLNINNDATLRNLAFSGMHDWNGHAGGIAIHAGNVTVSNSEFAGNDQAILMDDSTAISLSIYNSEINSNGNNDKGTHNLRVGAVNSFVLKNSAVHGAFSGHEISTSSYNTDIESNRIWDGAGVQASFAIDLSQGGNAVIKGNTIEKGADAANGVFILDGGEGSTYTNSNVQITGNTFVSDLQNMGHPYTYFIASAAGTFATPATTVSGNTFVGGVPGSQQTVNLPGTDSSGNVTAANAAVDMTTPGYSAALAPAAPSAPTAGPDVLSLSLSGTAGAAGAGFLVSVDGMAVGGGTVTASDAAGARQAFSYTGNWGTGSHVVSVAGLNIGGGAAQASNLYVDGITLDGNTSTARTALDGYTPASSTTLGAVATPAGAAAPDTTTPDNTTPDTTTPGTTTLGTGPDGIVLRVSEDAWQGDAQFTVSVDGQQIGGTQTATASHAAGQSQAFTLQGSFGTAPHTVAVAFLNDAYGGTSATDRNLYVDGLSDGTATTAGGALWCSGALSFLVAPPEASSTAAPNGATTVGSGPNRIALGLSEDAWLGDAQFTLTVDGQQVGGTLTAGASHAAGQSGEFDILGAFAPGAHQVGVTFTNDAYGGTSATDRNLYVDQIGGTAVETPLWCNGTHTFTTLVPAS